MKTRTVKGVEQGWCAPGEHWLPLTDEHFYFKGRGAQRHRYNAACRAHERERSAAWHREHRKAAEPAPKESVKKTAAKKASAARPSSRGLKTVPRSDEPPAK